MKKILCYGNPFIREDNLAVRLASILKIEGYEFIPSDNPQDVINHSDAYAIMDVTFGITEIKVLEDFTKLKPKNMASLHDFDLSFFLKLMHETGKIKEMKIIALPAKMDINEAAEELRNILTKTL